VQPNLASQAMTSKQCAKCSKVEGLLQCSRCKNIMYCSKECQLADWKLHKPQCAAPPLSEHVRGIIIPCNADKRKGAGIFQTIDIEPTHRIHSHGEVCPVSEQVGLPLVMYRHLQENPLYMTRDAGLDNQIATYLMIGPESGFAPPNWQQCVGTVTVMRKDGKPLTHEAIETIWMYHDHLLDLFGDGATPRQMMTRAGFERYCKNYKHERLVNGYEEFRDMPVPL